MLERLHLPERGGEETRQEERRGDKRRGDKRRGDESAQLIRPFIMRSEQLGPKPEYWEHPES